MGGKTGVKYIKINKNQVLHILIKITKNLFTVFIFLQGHS